MGRLGRTGVRSDEKLAFFLFLSIFFRGFRCCFSHCNKGEGVF